MVAMAMGLGVLAQAETAVFSETFDDGMGTWVYAPGTAEMGGVIDGDAERGKILELHPDGAVFGVNSRLLKVGEDLSLDKTYKVSARIRSEGLAVGVLAFSICCRNAGGNASTK